VKVFLDTDVLVGASVRQHPHFVRASAVLERCSAGEEEGVIHAHSLLEYHSAITQLPRGLAVPAAHVATLLNEGILPFVRCVALDAGEVAKVQARAGELGVVGGMIYDLYHLWIAAREDVSRLYTFNTGHFRELAEAGFRDRIVSP
jgi:predicted nucleic acid-binding protein